MFQVIRKSLPESLIGEVINLRIEGGMLQYTRNGTTWQDLAELGQVISAAAETLNPGDPATATLIDGILTIGVPAGMDGTNGLDGAPGNDGASVQLRVSSGWVQWRQDDDSPTWENLYQVPSGETGEDVIATTEPILVQTTLHHSTLATAGIFDVNIGANAYIHFTIYFKLRGASAGTAGIQQLAALLYFNNDTVLTGNNYLSQRSAAFNAAAALFEVNAGSIITFPASGAPAGEFARGRIDVFFSGDANRKSAQAIYGSRGDDGSIYTGTFSLHWEGTAPITRFTLNCETGVFAIGSELQIVGWKELDVVTGVTGTGVQGAAGAAGREVEMNSVLDDAGDCQAIQWRYAGDVDWITLVSTPICDDDGVLPNSAQNRCGAAVAVTAALKARYQHVKLDPDAWDELQAGAALAATVGGVGLAAKTAVIAILGAGAIATGLGLFGAVVGGVGILASFIIGVTNDNSDAFTGGVEELLVEGLYCVLTRRETTSIGADVLREWIGYIADAGFPEDDLLIVVGILGFIPVSYWQNEAIVSQPAINPCVETTCSSRDQASVYQISASLEIGDIDWNHPVVASMVQVVTGTRTVAAVLGVPNVLNTHSFNIRVRFGRIVPLIGIEADVNYEQTAAGTSPVLSLAAAGIGETVVVVGEDAGTAHLVWSGTASVSEFSLSGQVATAGEFDETAFLELFRLKVCGGYPFMGVELVAGDPCEVPAPADPCDDYDWSIERDLTVSNSGFVDATWVNGLGLHQQLTSVGSPAYQKVRRVRGYWAKTFGQNQRVKRIEIEFELTKGDFGGVGTMPTALYMYNRSVTSGGLYIFNVAWANLAAGHHTYVWQASPGSIGVEIIDGLLFEMLCGYSRVNIGSTATDPGGELYMERVRLCGDDTPPAGMVDDADL